MLGSALVYILKSIIWRKKSFSCFHGRYLWRLSVFYVLRTSQRPCKVHSKRVMVGWLVSIVPRNFFKDLDLRVRDGRQWGCEKKMWFWKIKLGKFVKEKFYLVLCLHYPIYLYNLHFGLPTGNAKSLKNFFIHHYSEVVVHVQNEGSG